MINTEFTRTGKMLGKGSIRSFWEVQTGNDDFMKTFAATKPPGETRRQLMREGEYILAKMAYDSGMMRETSRLVLPLAFQADQDGMMEIFYPQIGDGKNLLDVVINSNITSREPNYIEIARIATDVARGIDTMHSLGIQHNDVKFSNVLPDETGYYLADFNICSTDRDPQKDRLKYLHMLQMLLLMPEINDLFVDEKKMQCSKIPLLQGLMRMDGGYPHLITGVIDNDRRISMMIDRKFYPYLGQTMAQIENDPKMSLVTFAERFKNIIT